ncbi:MAG: hypothetical protein ACLQBD_01920 [Syntrophobacteraceae bacterium]
MDAKLHALAAGKLCNHNRPGFGRAFLFRQDESIVETLDFIAQGWMVLFGCAAIWLLGRREQWRKWGYIAGLLSEPAWFFSGFYHHQWGLILVTCWYTYCLTQGAWNFWVRPR